MDRIPLIGGSYQARWVGAAASRCINYFPEINPKDSPVPFTYYQRPGLRKLVRPAVPAPCRALYQASNGNSYTVIGSTLYRVFKGAAEVGAWTLGELGDLEPDRTNPVSMVDNGIDLVVVDGSPHGWTANLATGVFAQIDDTTGIFQGADRLDYMDGFILWNMPQSIFFGSTLFGNPITFDGLYFAGKGSYPDLLQTLIINRKELLLLGSLRSEIWYNAGGIQFPFAQMPGSYIEHGIAAKYSVAASDINVFWLGRDSQGQGIVFRQRGYQTNRVSNHGLEVALRKLGPEGITDAIGYCYQQDGHVFYVLHLPSGDQTWSYDDSISDPMLAWHQEAWTDGDGRLRRHRGNCYASLFGTPVVGDWENGTLYAMDPSQFEDEVEDAPSPLVCIRSFPHLTQAKVPGGQQLLPTSGRRVEFKRFWLDLECGTAPVDVDGNPAQVTLRWSDDKGRSFGQDVLQSAGELGQYLTQPQWPGLGIARDRVFEIQHSIAGSAALNGAWVDAEVLDL